MSKSKIFLFFLAFFLAGVAARSFVFIPWPLFLGAILVSGVLGAIGIRNKKKRSILAGLFISASVLGIIRYEMAEIARPHISQHFGTRIEVRGFVMAEPDVRPSVQQVRVRAESINGFNLESTFTILATIERYPELSFGDGVLLYGVMAPPDRLGDFDYPAYLSRENIFAVMSFPQVDRTGARSGLVLKRSLIKVKKALEANINNALPEPHSAFLKGLLLGERDALPQSIVDNFAITGTTHIVALSGYNITIVGRFMIAGLLFLTIPFRFSFWLATAAIALFVTLTGASPSVVRAGIMGILVLVAQREGRAYEMTNALAFAGAVMVFENPRILRFDAAFQLSFLATAGLLLLTPRVDQLVSNAVYRIVRLYRRMRRLQDRFDFSDSSVHRSGFFGFLRATFVETLSAQAMVLPLIVYLFGRVSIISPLANVAVLLAVPYAMAAGFVAACVGFISDSLARVFGAGAWVLLEYELRVIGYFARVPAASVDVGSYAALIIVALYVAIFIVIRKKKSDHGLL